MNDTSFLLGLPPRDVELWRAQAELNAGAVSVVVDRANVTPAPTSAAWSYSVPFHIVGTASGLCVPYTGNIVAGAGDTSSAGTASVDDSSPPVVMGSGTVKLQGDAQAWLNAETATLTLTYTDAYATAHTDTFVVTFTS